MKSKKENNERPIVSVIIPVKNGRDYIHEAISSILNDSVLEIEILVINDGSNDFNYNDLEIIDNRIKVINLEGGGVSFARNIGMKFAKGNYFAFLDADDVWFPGKLKAQIKYFNDHPEVGCVFGRFIKWHADSKGSFPRADSIWRNCSQLKKNEPERSGWLYTKLLTGLLVGMNTAVIRREVYDLLGGFDESMKIGEDYLFWLKISRVFQIHALRGPVALYRIHSSSAMNRLGDENHQVQLLKIAYARWGLTNPDGTCISLKSFNDRLALTEFTHGYNHYWNGNPLIAARAFKAAIIGHARPLRSSAYYLLSLGKYVLLNIYKRQ